MKKKEKKKQKQEENEQQIVIINNIQNPDNAVTDVSSLNLYGDITETRAAEIVSGMLYLENIQHSRRPTPEEDDDSDTEKDRGIKLFISTHGGSASDMFSILDVMKMVQKKCDIETIGIGKVMSAGVLLLSAGTPGKRAIGRNCRIMLHNVVAGLSGSVTVLENELEEIKWVQNRYIDCLLDLTSLTKSKIKKILKEQKDVYISAEDAIKHGIADYII